MHVSQTVQQYFSLKTKAPTYLEFMARNGEGSYMKKKVITETRKKKNLFNVQKLSALLTGKKAPSSRQFDLEKLYSNPHTTMPTQETKQEEDIQPIELLISRFTNMSLPVSNYETRLNKATETEIYYLSLNDTYGPFSKFITKDTDADMLNAKVVDTEGLQKYLFSFYDLKIRFTYQNIYTKGDYPELLIWDVELRYDFSAGAGVVPVTLKYEVGLGAENRQQFDSVLDSPLTWISAFIIFFSLFSTFLIIRAIFRSFRFIKKAMKKDRSIFQMMIADNADDSDEEATDIKDVTSINNNETTPLINVTASSPVEMKSGFHKSYQDDDEHDSYTGSMVSGMTFTSQYYQHVLDKHQSELEQLQKSPALPKKKTVPGIPHRIVTGEIGKPKDDMIEDAKNNLQQTFTPALKHKLKFFNPWHALGLISNIFAIVSSCMVFANVVFQYFSLDATNILLGLSAIFMWANIIQYLSHSPKFYVLIKSLRKGLPNIFRFIVGAAPLLIGYALCGMVLFGSYTEDFQDFQNSIVTLFAAANGDALIDTFNAIYGQNSVIAYFSRIYLITFVCLFTYSVVNIFILIMEDAYFSVKEANMKKEAAHRAAEAVHELKNNDGGAASGYQDIDHQSTTAASNNDASSTVIKFRPTYNIAQNNQNTEEEDDDIERLQQERSKIDELINLLSELRSGQLLGDSEDQDPQYAMQQRRLCEKLTKMLVNRNLKKIRRRPASTSDGSFRSALSSSFRKIEVGSFSDQPKKKKETKFNLDLNESIDEHDPSLLDDEEEILSPTPPNNSDKF